MIIKSLDLIKNIRDIYIYQNTNFTDILNMNILNEEYIDINQLFKLRGRKEYSQFLDLLVKDNDDREKKVTFSKEFNFKIEDKQKEYGNRILISEVIDAIIKKNKSQKKFKLISLGIGDGSTAEEYAKFINR